MEEEVKSILISVVTWILNGIVYLVDTFFFYAQIIVKGVLELALQHIHVATVAVILLLGIRVIMWGKKRATNKAKQNLAFPEIDKLKVAEMDGKKITANDGKEAGNKFMRNTIMLIVIIAVCYLLAKSM